jgi:hypothetical protein
VVGLRALTLPRRYARALLAVGALLSAPRSAQSQASDPPPQEFEVIAVELESGCVTAGEFVQRVKSRAARAREAAPGEPARRIRVTIEGEERVIGRLVMAGNDGAIVAREVEGATCHEVVEALALVLAVTLDPLAGPRPATDTAPPGSPAKPPPSPVPRPRGPAQRARGVPARSVGEARFRHLVSGEATLAVGLVDQPMAGLGARYATSREKHGGTTLLLTLGAFATFAADVPANHPARGLIRYRLQALDLGVCPVGARVHVRVRLYPCAALTVGRLQAEGIDLPGHRSDAALFLSAGVAGRATIELAGPLGLVGAAGLSFPLGGYSAVVGGAEESAGEVHPLGIIVTLGAAVEVP